MGWTLVGAGLLIFAFLGYQLWVTTLLTARAQDRLEVDLAARLAEVETVAVQLPTTVADDPTMAGSPETTVPPQEPLAVPGVELLAEPAPLEGAPLGHLIIPEAGVDHVMVEGVGGADLRKGPGHMPWTPLPGQPGNAVVSGHRTTYGAPFWDLNLLEPGDDIFVETAVGRHVYEVRELLVVAPTDVWVTDPRPGAWLTLTTCNPRFSAAERLIVFAEMVDGPNHPYVEKLLASATQYPASSS
ncbi:MAG: sortase [Acidimicrobiia bacterium]